MRGEPVEGELAGLAGPDGRRASSGASPQTAERSPRHGVRVVVDRALCVAFAECVGVAPTAFELDQQENVAVVLDPESVDVETLKAAARACPVSAIALFDADGAEIPL